jgi:Mn-dependent DtxR family transcriptional regulator
MTIWDDRIMEVLREEGPLSVGELTDHDSIRISHSQVSRRCSRLAEHGLLDSFANGVYSLTGQGESYLNGELNADELQTDDEEGKAAS